MISSVGGSFATSVSVVLQGQPADPLLPSQALRERKRCVTAHWLNTVLKRKKMLPPRRALHFPVAFPPGGRPCSQHVSRVCLWALGSGSGPVSVFHT